jgi:hypothetical protein
MRRAQWLPGWVKRILIAADERTYDTVVKAVGPINRWLARRFTRDVIPGSVLHVSGMVHVAYDGVRILRDHGVHADYLAVGTGKTWNLADYTFRPLRLPIVSVLKEMWFFWRIVSRYQIVHAHFIATLTRSGWEWPLLKRMGRRIVVHYRGCEIRNRDENRRRHPDINICEDCDYHPRLCSAPVNVLRRRLAEQYGDAFLATTPDLREFAPHAEHLPFFVSTQPLGDSTEIRPTERFFKIVHVTNHPGIEGTRDIRRAIESLQARGFAIDFRCLQGVPRAQVLGALREADVSIGKLKMGYYANAQIESLALGVPAITWVRDEFMTDELRDSGFIFSTLEKLESTLERLLLNPDELAAKRRVCRSSVERLHPNRAIVDRLRQLYADVVAGRAQL